MNKHMMCPCCNCVIATLETPRPSNLNPMENWLVDNIIKREGGIITCEEVMDNLNSMLKHKYVNKLVIFGDIERMFGAKIKRVKTAGGVGKLGFKGIAFKWSRL